MVMEPSLGDGVNSSSSSTYGCSQPHSSCAVKNKDTHTRGGVVDKVKVNMSTTEIKQVLGGGG